MDDTHFLDGIKLYSDKYKEHLYTLPLALTSFAAHPTVLPIYVELQKRDPKRMRCVILSGFLISLTIYIVLGSIGYFTFTANVKENILQNEYRNQPTIIVSMFGLCMVCLLACPLLLHAFRKSAINLFHLCRTRRNATYNPLEDEPQESTCNPSQNFEVKGFTNNAMISSNSIGTGRKMSNSRTLLNTNSGPKMESPGPMRRIGLADTPTMAFAKSREEHEIPKDSSTSPEDLIAPWMVRFLTVLTLVATTTIACVTDHIGTVLGLLGCTTVPFCCYIFPALLCYKLEIRLATHTRYVSYFAGFLLGIVAILCTIVWIRQFTG